MPESALFPLEPMVALITWFLTWALGRWMVVAERPKLRSALPLVALLLGVALQAVAEVVQGQPLAWSIVLQGLQVAGVTVLGHSALSELLKVVSTDDSNSPPTADAVGTTPSGRE